MGGCNSGNKSRQAGQVQENTMGCWRLCEVVGREPDSQKRPTKQPVKLWSAVENPSVRFQDDESAFNEQRVSNEYEKQHMMDRVIKMMLADESNTPKIARPQPGTNMKSRAGSRVSWIEVPDPLPEWTLEQQQVVIDILKEHPKAVRDAVQLELAMTKAYKRIPTKTAPDVHECLRHIEASRIAFFGKRRMKKSSC
jgi:hypothetical protein